MSTGSRRRRRFNSVCLDDGRKNYSIVLGKAYTEDNVLVHNLYIVNIPKETKWQHMFAYFQQFGDVKRVGFINNSKQKNVRTKVGFVNFSDPDVAASVLLKSNHYLNNKRMYIQACDSWHQPDAMNAVASNESADDLDSSIKCKYPFIFNLNHDCFEIIFNYLPLIYKINLARTCRRLRDEFIIHSKFKYKTLDLPILDCLTLWQTRQFFEMTGPQIETLEGFISTFWEHKRIAEFLGTYCTNVKNIYMSSTELRPHMMRKLLQNKSELTVLELKDACLTDNCIKLLKCLPNLRKLSLEGNNDLSGKFINELTKIESLSLNSCYSITVSNFTSICKNLVHLKSLDIHNCKALLTINFDSTLNCLLELEKLAICSSTYEVHRIGQLVNLKHLLVYDDHTRISIQPLFENLEKYNGKRLETLYVDTKNFMNLNVATCIAKLDKLKIVECPFNDTLRDDCLEKLALLPDLEVLNLKDCHNFTDEGLLNVIKSCHKLLKLNIMGCTQLNDSFCKELLNVLKSQRARKEQMKPLTILVYHTDFKKICVNALDLESAKDLVKFKYIYQYDDRCLDDFVDDDDDNNDFFLNYDDEYFMYYSDPDDDPADLDMFDALDSNLVWFW